MLESRLCGEIVIVREKQSDKIESGKESFYRCELTQRPNLSFDLPIPTSVFPTTIL